MPFEEVWLTEADGPCSDDDVDDADDDDDDNANDDALLFVLRFGTGGGHSAPSLKSVSFAMFTWKFFEWQNASLALWCPIHGPHAKYRRKMSGIGRSYCCADGASDAEPPPTLRVRRPNSC